MASTKSKRLILSLSVLALASTPAFAQMYPGEDVIVNPRAIGSPLPPIHLHMPARHKAKGAHNPPAAIETASVPDQSALPSEAAVRPTPPEQAVQPTETTLAPESVSPAAIPFSLGGSPSVAKPTAAPRAAETAPAKEAVKPRTVAEAAPTPAITPTVAPVHGLVKQAAILFDQSSSVISDNSSVRLKDLSASLNEALLSGADHVELVGYGGVPGDKSSDARRISLKRALAIREALIVNGLPASRIDVRALGGVTDNGPTDRVDIFIKG